MKKLESGGTVSLYSLALLAEALGAAHVLVSEPLRELDHKAVEQTVNGRSEVGPDVVQWLNRQVDVIGRLDDLLGGTQLVQLVDIDIALIEGLDSQDKSLLRGLAQLHRLAGWMWHDGGAYTQAEKHYQNSIRLSRQVGDGEYAAYNLALMGHMATLQGQPEKALLHLSEAEREAGPRSGLRVLTSMLAVHPLVALGKLYESQRMQDTADTLYEVLSLPDYLYWVAWSPSHRTEIAESFIQHDPERAIKLYQAGLAQVPSEYARDRIFYYIGLAEAYQSAGRLDECVASALHVASVRAQVPRAGQRLDLLTTKLPRDSVAQPLFDAIHDGPIAN